jgi:hypothetical protein
MGDEEWQRRQDVLEGKRRNSDPPASNVKSTDHTGDAKKSSDDRGKGTDTQAPADEQTAVQGDGPAGESI